MCALKSFRVREGSLLFTFSVLSEAGPVLCQRPFSNKNRGNGIFCVGKLNYSSLCRISVRDLQWFHLS